MLGPGLRGGFLLRVDMVAVPDPSWRAAFRGFSSTAPRTVPSDLVLTAAGHVLPPDVAQKALLLAVFVIAAAGVGALARSWPQPARLTAALFFVWNPDVAERLLLGHWFLLYGYAAMPWILRAVRERPSWRRMATAVLPAAVGGFVGMLLAGIVLVGACAIRRSRRTAAVGAAVWRALSLPWLVPALLGARALTGDPAGVDAFAARADTPFSVFGSLLMLGGVWNRDSVPGHYADGPLLVIRVLLTLTALAGVALFVAATSHRRPAPVTVPPLTSGPDAQERSRTDLAQTLLPAVIGLMLAAASATIPGRALLRAFVQTFPAAGVLRDAQQFVAPLALLEAVGVGAVVTTLMSSARLRSEGGIVFACTTALLPLVALPQLGWGVGGRLSPVWYPRAWTQVRAVVDADPRPGAILVLPWSAFRVYDWNRRTPVIDPALKFFDRPVVADDSVVVGGTTVAGEDPRVRRAGQLLAAHGVLIPADCTELGIRYVLVEDAPADATPPGFVRTLAASGLLLYRLP